MRNYIFPDDTEANAAAIVDQTADKAVVDGALDGQTIDNQVNVFTAQDSIAQTSGTVGVSQPLTTTTDEENEFRVELIREADEATRAHLVGLPQRDEKVASYTELIQAGFTFCVAVANRQVELNHVHDLAKSAMTTKKFAGYILVCSAKAALEAGVLMAGERGPVTAETPELDRMLLVIDGQHRLAALMSDPKLDSDVLVMPCPADVCDHIKRLNSSPKRWNVAAHRHLIALTTNQADKLKEAAARAERVFPLASEKFYNYVLTGKREAVRMSSVLKGGLPVFDEETAAVGMAMLRALRLLNPSGGKSKLTTLQLADAVFEAKAWHTGKFGGNQRFVGTLMAFCQARGEVKREGAMSFIENFVEAFKSYSTEHPEGPTDEGLKAIEARINELIACGEGPKFIARGSMFEVVATMKAITRPIPREVIQQLVKRTKL